MSPVSGVGHNLGPAPASAARETPADDGFDLALGAAMSAPAAHVPVNPGPSSAPVRGGLERNPHEPLVPLEPAIDPSADVAPAKNAGPIVPAGATLGTSGPQGRMRPASGPLSEPTSGSSSPQQETRPAPSSDGASPSTGAVPAPPTSSVEAALVAQTIVAARAVVASRAAGTSPRAGRSTSASDTPSARATPRTSAAAAKSSRPPVADEPPGAPVAVRKERASQDARAATRDVLTAAARAGAEAVEEAAAPQAPRPVEIREPVPAPAVHRATLPLTGEAGVEGHVTVALRGARLSASIVSAGPESAERMASRIGELREALAERGIEAARITVTVAGDAAGTRGERPSGDPHTPRPPHSNSRDASSESFHGRSRREGRRDPSERQG